LADDRGAILIAMGFPGLAFRGICLTRGGAAASTIHY
jgi:hypothetical protein